MNDSIRNRLERLEQRITPEPSPAVLTFDHAAHALAFREWHGQLGAFEALAKWTAEFPATPVEGAHE